MMLCEEKELNIFSNKFLNINYRIKLRIKLDLTENLSFCFLSNQLDKNKMKYYLSVTNKV